MRKFLLSIILISLLFTSCARDTGHYDIGHLTNGAEDVSIIQLIATPEKWNGKVIRVTGVMVLEFEGDAIYLSKQDAENHISKNALWLDIDYGSFFGIPDKEPTDPAKHKLAMANVKVMKSMIGRYVFLEGTFDMKSHGHLGLFSGSIKVSRIATVHKNRS